MKHILSILPMRTDERGIPNKHYSTMYDEIMLTDKEQFDALYEARKKKYYNEQSKEYFRKVHSGSVWDGVTAEKLAAFFETKLQKLIGKKPVRQTIELLQQLSHYYMCEAGVLNPDKGLLFMGNVGTGKTKLALSVIRNPRYEYTYETTRNISECYEIGTDHWEQFLKSDKSYIFDDVGTELIAQIPYTRKTTESVAELIYKRYDSGSLNNVIITTNLDAEAIAARYGDRIRDRIKECFNVVVFDWDSLR